MVTINSGSNVMETNTGEKCERDQKVRIQIGSAPKNSSEFLTSRSLCGVNGRYGSDRPEVLIFMWRLLIPKVVSPKAAHGGNVKERGNMLYQGSLAHVTFL